MNVSELSDIYDGNVEEWFKALIDESGLDYDEQLMTYERYKKMSHVKDQSNLKKT